MHKIRNSRTIQQGPQEKKTVPALHIDADEAHITLQGGKKSIVPLISVYEGIEQNGKRSKCKNIFHISEYGKKSEELWEQALNEVEERYNLTPQTKVYLHGDGANWIQEGLEWFPESIFVLDKYHKNKAIKEMTAGLPADRKAYEDEIRKALLEGEQDFFNQLTESIAIQIPDREEKVRKSGIYLSKQIQGIAICKSDDEANNGGCTEPHVSHVLSARLSSRPIAWGKKTLKYLAPLLAKREGIFFRKKQTEPSILLKKSTVTVKNKINKTGLKLGMPQPSAIGNLHVISNGKTTSLFQCLKSMM